jgi:hypothetical protein
MAAPDPGSGLGLTRMDAVALRQNSVSGLASRLPPNTGGLRWVRDKSRMATVVPPTLFRDVRAGGERGPRGHSESLAGFPFFQSRWLDAPLNSVVHIIHE